MTRSAPQVAILDRLRRMAGEFSLDVVLAYMRHVQDHAEESVPTARASICRAQRRRTWKRAMSS